MHMLGRLLPLVLLLLPPAEPAVADEPVIQQLETGCINWSAAVVQAKGRSTPAEADAERSTDASTARLDAARQAAVGNILETVAAIRIDATARVSSRMAAASSFREGLVNLARNATPIRQEYLSDGTLEIELSMPLTGGFAQFVLPAEIRQVDTVTATVSAHPSPDNLPQGEKNGTTGTHTGLILNAIGIGAQPALAPLVVDETGEVVYGPAFVSREYAVSQGMSGFSTTLAAARENIRRVGERPMVIKAIRTDARGSSALVIANTDAARLRSSAAYLCFLKACRVCIVLGPPPPPVTSPDPAPIPSDGDE
ncbi:hypothetical protein DSCOOX_40820 [Desulfosarcina ovata subsp. ovata]|uniref:LPP20 lipoprotein n=1 Tax=Desulfosarcina ovata subsp. ovata TaxID=2752305 RepID=A0A5K8AE56_9BACT|nr:hypothetical protein DSCOOX_40820 [Desulfosarcina ovata subsp. ovata]